MGLGFLTPLCFQSREDLGFPSALPVQTVLPLLTAIPPVCLQVQSVGLSRLKFRLLRAPDL